MNELQLKNKLPPVVIPRNPKDYQNPDIPDRKWKICFGKDGVFYLTDLERQYYLIAISNGVSVIQIGALTLSNHPLFISPIRKTCKAEDKVEILTISEEQRQSNIKKIAELKNKLFIKKV